MGLDGDHSRAVDDSISHLAVKQEPDDKMRFYASKTHDKMNTRDFSIELVTPYVCLNPYYSVTISDPSVHYILDSGAFQDVRTESRLTYEGALERQLAFEDKVGVR